MAVGESPKVAISSPAQPAEAEAGHQDPRAAGGARGAAEVVRGAQGPAPGRLGARDLPEAAEGETGSARHGGEAEDPGRAVAGSAQTLQALCGTATARRR